MAKTEIILGGNGGGELSVSTTTSIPAGSTSVPITCQKGDVILFNVTRSTSGYPILWNPHNPVVSSDYVQNNSETVYYKDLASNTWTFLIQATQESNTLAIYTGATMQGEYVIITDY